MSASYTCPMHPGMYKWSQSVVAVVALWLITSPMMYDYGSRALAISDIVSG